MAKKNIIKDNLIGALAGGILVFFLPQYFISIGITIFLIPSSIEGFISKLLTVLAGAFLGGLIQMLIKQTNKK